VSKNKVDADFEKLADAYEQARQQQPMFDRETASAGAKLLNQGVPARQVLDTCLNLDAKRGKASVGRPSVEYTIKWLLQKKLAERNGGSGNERP
jgi:hypothetical protein